LTRPRHATPPNPRHTAGSAAEWTPIEIDTITAIANDPDLYTLATEIAHRRPGDPGRPCPYPSVVWLFYITVAGVLGSHRKAAAAIHNTHYWNLFRRAARKTATLRLPRTPPSRNQCEYHRGQLTEQLDTLLTRFRELAAARAIAHDCLDPTTPRSAVNLPRGAFVAVDGKVLRSPIRKKTAEKWRAQGRRLIDGADHIQGGDDKHPVFGVKALFATTRADNTRNNRIVIDVRHVPEHGAGGEAGVAVQALRALAQRAPGLRGVCYDGALRGTHIDAVTKLGLCVLSPTNKGIKPTILEQISCPCGDNHELWTADGRIVQPEILDTGDTVYRPCPVAKTYWRHNPAAGTYRHYQDIAVAPCGTIHTQRVDTTRADRARGYNRAEHLRQHVKTETGHSVYDRQYGLREDVEAFNDLLQSTLHKGRVPAFTVARQILWALGFAFARNSIAHYLRAQHGADPPQLAA
jgi:hypothetical protein